MINLTDVPFDLLLMLNRIDNAMRIEELAKHAKDGAAHHETGEFSAFYSGDFHRDDPTALESEYTEAGNG